MRNSEKQLLCMARAILKRSKVLVMDEVRCPFLWFLLFVVDVLLHSGYRKVNETNVIRSHV